jgi:glycosyltransferase involved in cell wall biosynthesis
LRGQEQVRITFVLPGISKRPTGGFKVSYQYANALAAKGHRVTVVHPFTLDRHPALLDSAKYVRRRWHHARHRAPYLDWFQFDKEVRVKLVPVLRGFLMPAADVTVLTAWETAEQLTPRSPRRLGALAQIVYDVEFWRTKPELRERMGRALARSEVRQIATSSAVVEMLAEVGRAPYALVTAGLEEGDFDVDEPVPTRGRVVGFAFRHGATKDVETAFTAARLIQRAAPDVVVQCFGQDGNVPDGVTILGRLSHEELRRFYNRCAVFMLTSRYEGWGLPAAEAMACGAAVVSTRNRGTEDFLHHEQNGLLTPVRDPEAVASCVLRRLDNDVERVRLASQGASDAATMTTSRSAEWLDQILRDIAAFGPPIRESR